MLRLSTPYQMRLRELKIYRPWPLLVTGQLDYGKWDKAATNGLNAEWIGVSALAGYKFTPGAEGVLRADYIKNSKN